MPFHLSPFTIKDLDQLSLASRIRNCPQLKDIRCLYPDIDKEVSVVAKRMINLIFQQMLGYFETEERYKANESPTGYIGSEIVMVAKTVAGWVQSWKGDGGQGKTGNWNSRKLSSVVGSDSPSPMSNSQWSPGEFQQSSSMDIGDEVGGGQGRG